MKAVHPVVGKAEYAKPDQKYRIVKGETVKQNLFEGIGVHGAISHKGYPFLFLNIIFFLNIGRRKPCGLELFTSGNLCTFSD